MKIALIGYGKMGQTIEKLLLEAGAEVVAKIDRGETVDMLDGKEVDLAIEFTQPDAAFDNIQYCIANGIKVISGTTGWLAKLQAVRELCEQKEGTFLYASNFSIGVNLFFELNEWLSKKMAALHFIPELSEVHHTEKRDSPSGTAITLAEGIIEHSPKITTWINEKSTDHQKLGIISEREPNVPGTHSVTYASALETIEITHTAHDRSVFAEGVVKVAQWIQNQKGYLTMSDFLNNH